MKKAVVLLSGGLDSATTAAIARSQSFDCYCLSFRYGQRHAVELKAAERVAALIGAAEHHTIDLDLRFIGGSALTSEIAVPKDREADAMKSGIPITYVPARNTIFLSYAVGYAEVLGSSDIFIGVNAVDYSGYPDCREPFIRSFEQTAQLATRAGVEEDARLTVHTPLLMLTKGEIIRLGLSLGVDYSITHSCYDPAENGISCGHCDACILRLRGFAEAGLADPIRYRNNS